MFIPTQTDTADDGPAASGGAPADSAIGSPAGFADRPAITPPFPRHRFARTVLPALASLPDAINRAKDRAGEQIQRVPESGLLCRWADQQLPVDCHGLIDGAPVEPLSVRLPDGSKPAADRRLWPLEVGTQILLPTELVPRRATAPRLWSPALSSRQWALGDLRHPDYWNYHPVGNYVDVA